MPAIKLTTWWNECVLGAPTLPWESNESLASADKAVSNAAQVGNWVLIKNVHLAPTWLQSLEKRMESLNPHSDFRLFLSMESSPKIPVNLLRASRVLMYEQPAGVRANMKDSISSLATRATKSPVERTRLYLLPRFCTPWFKSDYDMPPI